MTDSDKKFVFALFQIPGEMPIVHIVTHPANLQHLLDDQDQADTLDLRPIGVPLRLMISARPSKEEAIAYVKELGKKLDVPLLDKSASDFGMKTPVANDGGKP